MYGHGMCRKHMRRQQKHGDPLISGRKPRAVCNVLGCDNFVHAHGLCQKHEIRLKTHGDVRRGRVLINVGNQCSVPNCHRAATARGLCPAHRLLTNQETIAGRVCPEVCDLCGNAESRKKPRSSETQRMSWDHDHKTGKFRGWICHDCNTSLGKAKDNPSLLRRMAEYIETGGACVDNAFGYTPTNFSG